MARPGDSEGVAVIAGGWGGGGDAVGMGAGGRVGPRGSPALVDGWSEGIGKKVLTGMVLR